MSTMPAAKFETLPCSASPAVSESAPSAAMKGAMDMPSFPRASTAIMAMTRKRIKLAVNLLTVASRFLFSSRRSVIL